jgi:hypothetical protein
MMQGVYALAEELKTKHPEVLRIAKETYKIGSDSFMKRVMLGPPRS